MEDPLAPRMKYKVIEPRKPKRVSKGLWESRKSNGPRMPKRKMGHRSLQTM